MLCSVIKIYKKLTEVQAAARGVYDKWFLPPNPSPSFGSLFWEFISNCTQTVRGGGVGVSLPFKFDRLSFENVQFPLDVKETTFLVFLVFYLVSFLYVVHSLSRIRAQISRTTAETPDPEVENPEWCGEWEDIGQILKKFSDPMVCNFSPEQVQKPAEVAKYLKEKYNNNSNENKLLAICWALAYAYRTLQQVRVERQEDKSAKPADTPVTQAAATPDSKPKPDGESKPLTVAPVTRKKHTTKTDCPVKDDDDGGEVSRF